MEDNESRFTLFGTDLQKIPCFKKTFTASILSGLALGLGHFIFTSHIKRSTDVAVYSFAGITVAFWSYCRYNWSKEHLEAQKMNRAFHDVMISQGTHRKSTTNNEGD